MKKPLPIINELFLAVVSILFSIAISLFNPAVMYGATKNASSSDAPEESLLNQYLNIIKEIYLPLKQNGISMDEGNTIEEVEKYVLALAPEVYDSNIFVEIKLQNLPGGLGKVFPAIAGTKYNPKGKLGFFGLSILIRDSFTGKQEEIRYICNIYPTEYTGSNSNSNSSGRGSYYSGGTGRSAVIVRASNAIATKNPYIYVGVLENKDNKLRLRKPDGTYASSQWAYINDHWYIFGNDTYALTGWQKVNGYLYYMDTNGIMFIGLNNINGELYYLNEHGTMVTGWNLIDGNWYYFDGSGKMLRNTITPDGYYLNSNGEWIE